MELTNEMKDSINKVFSNDNETREKLLDNDSETIIKVGLYGSERFQAEDVIDCYETETLDYLYKIALKKREYSELYFQLIGNTKGPYATKYEIDTLFDNDNRTKEELLKEDDETLIKIGSYGNSGITPLEMIDAYENNKLDELYERAKKKKMYIDVYFESIREKAKESASGIKK